MTDARLPGRWLMDPTMRTIGADLWTVFSWALMWSAEQGTDGLIPQHMLPLLHPSGATAEHAEGLILAGLWARERDAYRVQGWEQTQTLASVVEAQRAANRERQRRHRAKSSNAVTTPVSHVGQERPGQDRPGEARHSSTTGAGTVRGRTRESPDERVRRLMATADAMERADSSPAASVTDWPVRAIPE